MGLVTQIFGPNKMGYRFGSKDLNRTQNPPFIKFKAMCERIKNFKILILIYQNNKRIEICLFRKS